MVAKYNTALEANYNISFSLAGADKDQRDHK
jgi:hypothetical protein